MDQPTEEPEDEGSEWEIHLLRSIAGANLFVTLSISTSKGFSSQKIFGMINQFQLFLLLPMLPSYFPPRLVRMILGVDLALISFDFLEMNSASFIDKVHDLVKLEQNDEYLQEIGVESGSAIVNITTTTVLVGIIILCHIAFGILYWFLRSKLKLGA